MTINIFICKVYFLIYFYLILSIIIYINFFNIKSLTQINLIYFKLPIIGLIFFSIFLSLGGLPPLIGFFPKILVIQSIINHHLSFIRILLIICSLYTLFYYLRTTYFKILKLHSIKKIIIITNYINNLTTLALFRLIINLIFLILIIFILKLIKLLIFKINNKSLNLQFNIKI